MYKCPSCHKEMIWGGDHTFEDYSIEGDGIVTNCYCNNYDCNVTDILIYQKI